MNSSTVEFEFVGKGGKRQHQRVRDPRVVRLIARLGEPPGSEVFRFVDEEGVVHSLRSRHVNAYVKKHMGEDFTVKDFRTWGGTVFVASALLEIEPSQLNSAQDRSTAVREAVSGAAQRLGNTPAVTRSSYIDPRVLEAVEHPKMLAKVRKARLRTSRYLNPGEQRTIRLLSEMTRSRKP